MRLKTGLALAAMGLVAMMGAQVAYAVDPCSLLTQADVSAALGATAGAGSSMATTMCMWTAPGQNGVAQKVALTIGNAQRFAMAKTPVNSPAITKTPVSGVGDDAVFGTTARQAASINVKKGDTYFAISLMGVSMARAQTVATALARSVVGRL